MATISRQVRVQVTTSGATDFSSIDFTLDAQLSDVDVISLSPKVRPLEGKTDSRSLRFTAIDASSILTAKLADADGYMHLLGRLIRLQVNDDAAGWTSKASGRLTHIAETSGPGEYTLEISDERWLEREAKVLTRTDTNGLLPTTSLLPPGTLYDWYGFPSNVRGEDGYLIGYRVDSLTGNRYDISAYHGVDELNYPASFRYLESATRADDGSLAHVKARLVSSVGVLLDDDAKVWSVEKRPLSAPVTIRIETTATPGSEPRIRLYSLTDEPNETLPLHIGVKDDTHDYGTADGGIDPWVLWQAWADEVGLRYNSAAVTALQGVYPRVHIRHTDGALTMAEAAERYIYKPTLTVPFVNADGEVAPTSITLPRNIDPTTLFEFNASNVVTAPTWEHSLADAVTSVKFTHPRFASVEFDEPGGGVAEAHSADLLLVTEASQTERNTDTNLAVGGAQTDFALDGLGNGRFSSISTLLNWALALRQARETIARNVFQRYGNGAQVVHLTASALAAGISAVDPGDFVTLDQDTLLGPNPASNARTGDRVLQVLQKEETLGGLVRFELLDAGPELQPLAAPTVTTALNATRPKHDIDVTIGSTPAVAGTEVVIEIAYNATEPAASSALWHAVRSVTANGTYTIPDNPSGKKAYIRAYATAPTRIMSAYATADTETTTSLTAPSACTGTVANRSIRATWTNGETGYAIMPTLDGVDYLTGYLANPLPPGSTFFVWEGLAASTAYTIGVKHVDEYGGASAIATDTETTGTAATLEAVDAAALIQYRESTTAVALGTAWILGGGFEVTWSPSDHAETVWVVSTAADFSTTEKTYRFGPGMSRAFIPKLPLDNTLRYLRCRYERVGWTAGAWKVPTPASGYPTILRRQQPDVPIWAPVGLYIPVGKTLTADGGISIPDTERLTVSGVGYIEKTMTISFMDLLPRSSTTTWTTDEVVNPWFITPIGAAASIFYKALPLPVGATITAFSARLYVNTTASDIAEVSLYEMDSADTLTAIDTIGDTGLVNATWTSVSASGLTEVVAGGSAYFLRINLSSSAGTGNARFARATVTYRVPDYATAI